MTTKISEIVDELLGGIQTLSRSETIVGEPQQAGDATVIPVHRLRVAFGAASANAGAKSGESGGDSGAHAAGGSVELDPVAAIAVGRDGHAHLLTVEGDASAGWAQLVAQVPDLIARVTSVIGDRLAREVSARASRPAAVAGAEDAKKLSAEDGTPAPAAIPAAAETSR